MGAEKEKPVWERIAELGFADAVESKGFTRVGKTHWKMEGGGLTWRVLLVRGYKATPTSFLPVHGAYVHGLDELYARWDGSKASQYLHGSRQRVHMQSDTGGNVWDAQKREFDRLYPPPRIYGGWLGLFKDILEDVGVVRSRPIFDRDFLNIQFWGVAGNRLTARAFLTDGHDICDVARVVTGYWRKYSWPWIEARQDFDDLYRLHWAGNLHRCEAVLPFDYAVAKLAEDRSFMDSMARRTFAKAESAIEMAARMGFRLEEVATLHRDRPHSTARDRTIGQLIGCLSEARMLVGISRAFELGIPEPEIDLLAFEKYILTNYGPGAPVLSH
ncbi:hypothetical protein [Minwuia thermotolerans]|uniref:Uncharacterized protein n=1 Tax=Minwuia thermotolerans TaxID=2056226 RepID=A0A2M9G529_9PROT|nr:hypothetical protein [Minwuia thermotolerans]PJK30823.1 hypothetical protein CVT23_05520 [Minwuia thermotolerans]